MERRSAVLALVLVTALAAVPVAVQAQGNALAELGGLLSKDPRFSTVLQLISNSDVASLVSPILSSGNKTTVLLPTVDAFDRVFHDFSKFSPGFNVKTFLTLKNNSVAKLLSYHLVKGLYRRANLKKGLRLSTYNGANITVNRYRKSVRNRTYEVIHFVDVARRQAAVNRFDINATSNIVIHVLEKVLLPAPVRTFLKGAGLKV